MTQHIRIPCGRSVLSALASLCLAGPALANGPAAAPPPASGSKSARPPDAISLIEGEVDAWSVSNTPAGCYVMSPRRMGSSRLALGRHPVLGSGLFAVGFALSMAGRDAQEPIGIETSPVALVKPGRMVAAGVLFVPLAAPDLAASVTELRDAGVLWFKVRGTGIAHHGKRLGPAIDSYVAACLGTDALAAPASHHE